MWLSSTVLRNICVSRTTDKHIYTYTHIHTYTYTACKWNMCKGDKRTCDQESKIKAQKCALPHWTITPIHWLIFTKYANRYANVCATNILTKTKRKQKPATQQNETKKKKNTHPYTQRRMTKNHKFDEIKERFLH